MYMALYNALGYGPSVTIGLPATHIIYYEPHLSLLPSRKASSPFGDAHCAYAGKDNQAELIWLDGYIPT